MPRFLLSQISLREALWLALLMALSGATEGFGLLLLVPMLQALGGPSAGQGPGGWMARAGLPETLGALLALFVALVIARATINLLRALAGQRFQIRLVDGLRNRAWDALLHCDWRLASQMRQTDNASALISNIDRIGSGVSQLLTALATAATLLGVGAAALAISPAVTAGAVAGGLLVLLAYRRLGRRAANLGEHMGQAYRAIHGTLSENLGALRVIKSFGREEQARAAVANGFRGLRRAEFFYLRDSGLAKFTLEVAGAIFVALLVWLAVARWHRGPAEIVPLVVLFGRGLPLLAVFQGAWQHWAHCRPALDEIASLIARAEASREPGGDTQDPPPLNREIAFDGVTVRYAGRVDAVLADATLTIPARGITALVGPSGAGKSTLADLAGGLIAPDAGMVRIDGVGLGEELKRAWRRSVAYVQQEPVLFSGSIRDNLCWADPSANEAQLKAALARASAGFVEHLPAGLDSQVGEGGRHLSGGERQRIVLARALLRQPALLILDEATSALDAENESAIAAALDRLRGEMAILAICHRGALPALADRIVTMDRGRIVAVEDRDDQPF
ncbi:MAG: ABC transporter ATP-binding protein [Novosphingobium sp.]